MRGVNQLKCERNVANVIDDRVVEIRIVVLPYHIKRAARWRSKVISLAPIPTHAEALPQATSPFFERVVRPQVSPRRELSAKIYASEAAESIKAE